MKTTFKILGFSAILTASLAAAGQVSNSVPAAIRQTNELRLNFRAAPLESILDYLSQAAGFIIDVRADLRGKATIWSSQPVSLEEGLRLLDTALDQNGYAAVRQGRSLIICTKEEAKRRNLPVKSGRDPQAIPKTDDMVTQVIPVHFLSAVQVARDLQPLIPAHATLTVNEGGNSVVMTDTQVAIHRFAEILSALDTSVTSISRLRVFPLKFADAKTLASVLKDLFQPSDTSRSGGQNSTAGNVMNTFQNAGPGGGGFPGDPGGFTAAAGTGTGDAASAAGRAPVPSMVAVAEERSNSLVVSASGEQMAVIERVIAQVDVNTQDITELRVFHLRNADADETAELVTSLLGDTNSNGNQASGGPMQFSGSFGAGGAGNATSSQSTRFQKQTRVLAVSDPRTSSVVVSAAHELMAQIAGIITDLDSDRARKQQVFVFDAQNSEVQSIQNILQSLFPSSTSGSSATTRQGSTQNGVGDQLENRATQNQSQRGSQGSGSSGLGGGNSGLGGSSSLGGTGR